MIDKPEDDAEFSGFYAETSRSLWAYLSRACRNDAVADDLVQETYFRYLKSDWRKIAAAERRFYLFRIGSNVLLDYFRQQKRWGDGGSAAEIEAVRRDPALRIDLGDILKTELTARETQLLWLAYAEEFSHREIAAMTQLKENSIRPMLSRAREKLAALLTAAGYRRAKGGAK